MSTGPQILVVSSSGETFTLIDHLLQGIGVRPIWVRDGTTALALLDEALVPSLVILDMALPNVDGFELLANLRKIARMDSVPVLILPEVADPDVIRRGLDSGADAYVTKPYLTHSLLDRVRVLVAAGRKPRPRTRFYGRTTPLAPKSEAPAADDAGAEPEPDTEPEPESDTEPGLEA